MATSLNRDVIRLSSEKVNDKEIIIKLTSNQEIELKLKGERGSGKVISILDLYNYLHNGTSIDSNGDSSSGSLVIKRDKVSKSDMKMISLYDLRSHNAISTLSVSDISKFDMIIQSVIESM